MRRPKKKPLSACSARRHRPPTAFTCTPRAARLRLPSRRGSGRQRLDGRGRTGGGGDRQRGASCHHRRAPGGSAGDAEGTRSGRGGGRETRNGVVREKGGVGPESCGGSRGAALTEAHPVAVAEAVHLLAEVLQHPGRHAVHVGRRRRHLLAAPRSARGHQLPRVAPRSAAGRGTPRFLLPRGRGFLGLRGAGRRIRAAGATPLRAPLRRAAPCAAPRESRTSRCHERVRFPPRPAEPLKPRPKRQVNKPTACRYLKYARKDALCAAVWAVARAVPQATAARTAGTRNSAELFTTRVNEGP